MSPIKESALNTFRAEAEAVQSLAGQLTDDFEKAVRAILATHGKVIVTGMGKSPRWPVPVPRRSSSIRGKPTTATSA